MVDRKPPRVLGGERETLTSLLQYQRDSFARKVAGVSEEDARRSPVASGTTLLWTLSSISGSSTGSSAQTSR